MRDYAALVLVLPMGCCGPAMAQTIAQMPPQSAAKSGGVEGDSTGALGALGSRDDAGGAKADRTVKIPRLGGEESRPVGGPPPGTTGR